MINTHDAQTIRGCPGGCRRLETFARDRDFHSGRTAVVCQESSSHPKKWMYQTQWSSHPKKWVYQTGIAWLLWDIRKIRMNLDMECLYLHCLAAAGFPPLLSCVSYQSAIIWVFPRGVALFDATVHFSCICFVLAAPWISSVRSRL